MADKLTFTAQIQIRGINPYLFVSAEQAATLKPNWRRPLPVLVQINRQPDPPWRINMMPDGEGNFYLYLHEIVRSASSAKVGDVVQATLSFDEEYKNGPQHPMPASFEQALSKNLVALTNWQNLSPSRQKEILRYLHTLKSDEAMARNLVRVMDVIGGNEGHFMGRDWINGK
jgi:hypothetical protein